MSRSSPEWAQVECTRHVHNPDCNRIQDEHTHQCELVDAAPAAPRCTPLVINTKQANYEHQSLRRRCWHHDNIDSALFFLTA